MAKGKRNKQRQVEQKAHREWMMFQDCSQNLALAAAAKVMSDEELDMIFKGQEARLKKLGYTAQEANDCMANLTQIMANYRGVDIDSSAEIKNIRSN